MRVGERNWFQIEDYLKHDNRAVVPLGSTEQHAYLSLSVDSILSERVAAEAAEPLGVPVFPVEERAVPQTDVPGEVTSPTQPFPLAPPDLVPLEGLEVHCGHRHRRSQCR